MSVDVRLDKKLVAESFSRAAASYDQVAHLQCQVGEELLGRYPWHNNNSLAEICHANTIVDLGCGTGHFLPILQRMNPASTVVAMDLAVGMVTYAREKCPTGAYVVADMDQLPIKQSTVAMIYSSLAVQWSADLAAVLKNAYEALIPGGIFMFTTLLDGTLRELSASWQAADNYRHVNQFLSSGEVETLIAASPFSLTEIQKQSVELQYADVRELTNELKKLGAHNVNPDRAHGMTGKSAIRAFKQAYEGFRKDGVLPASYEVAYIYLRK
ncbi:MAG: malonyl-ACP O-methyltransferase BioC [Hahellaceae bacterium]|jgi:malonyl-CoA O-methyltransferase|nr:malonyl-ACP O-methyltransferase BioC [Hahellaceae bacterium]MCP5211176.1 malonyl-ACP O-methyltransferase BioC [Hahellaceae bacterium]